MKTLPVMLLCCAPLALVAGQPRAARQDAAVKAIVDKARAALGGEEKLSKIRAATWKGKGNVRFMGQLFGYSGSWSMQGASQSLLALDIAIDKNNIPYARVISGENVWVKIGQGIQKLKKEDMDELRREAYWRWVTTLVPLGDKGFKLEPLGELTVNDVPTVGLKVHRKGEPTIDLYFEKATGVLVKSAHPVREGGKEVIQESVWSAFEMQDGLRRPTRVSLTRDGNMYAEGELSDFRLF
jgi:hypothetical protein